MYHIHIHGKKYPEDVMEDLLNHLSGLLPQEVRSVLWNQGYKEGYARGHAEGIEEGYKEAKIFTPVVQYKDPLSSKKGKNA